MKASWRTSVFGAGGIITVVAATINTLFDGNPATNPDWAVVIASLTSAIGLLFARDDKVSTEEAIAKP